MNLSTEHIVSDPDMCFGKPRIAGTRFTVKDVAAYHLYQTMPLSVIAAKWNLPIASVYAALAYYYDHKPEIDQSFAEDDAFIRKMKEEQAMRLA